MKITILDDYQGALRGLECIRLLEGHEVTGWDDHVADSDELVARLASTEALVLIRERSRMPAPLLERLPNLKLISNLGSHGHVDVEACTRLGIAVASAAPAPGTFNNTAELTWGLILAAMRQIPQQVAALRNGAWAPMTGRNLNGNTLGIYGYGRLGSVVAGYGRAFGMHVVILARPDSATRAAADGYEIAESREAFFSQCDVVSLHLRLLDETRGTVRESDLTQMKPDALLVNTSRAELIAPGALVAALEAGRPGMAALDVYDEEPFEDANHPLLNMPNVVCTPHIGYVTREAFEPSFADVFRQIVAYADGAPTNLVNPEVLGRSMPGR